MEYITDRVRQIRFLIKLIIWLRRLISENKIPDTLLDNLKTYIPDLSQSIIDIEFLNMLLRNDINHLNNKEELEIIKKAKDTSTTYKIPFYKGKTRGKKKTRKYHDIRVIRFYDIIEFPGIPDRMFVIYIDMDDSNGIYSYLKRYAAELEEAFYFKVKLSTLMCIF